MFDALSLTLAERETLQHAIGQKYWRIVEGFVNSRRQHSAYTIEDMAAFARELAAIILLQREYIEVLNNGGDCYGSLLLSEFYSLICRLEHDVLERSVS